MCSSVSVSTAKQSSRMSTGALRIRPRAVSRAWPPKRDSSLTHEFRVFPGSPLWSVLNLRGCCSRFRRGHDLGHRKSGFPLKALQRETDLEAPLRLVIEAAIKDRGMHPYHY